MLKVKICENTRLQGARCKNGILNRAKRESRRRQSREARESKTAVARSAKAVGGSRAKREK